MRYGFATATRSWLNIAGSGAAAGVLVTVWVFASSYAFLYLAGLHEFLRSFNLFHPDRWVMPNAPLQQVIAEDGNPWLAIWDYAEPTDEHWLLALIAPPLVIFLLFLLGRRMFLNIQYVFRKVKYTIYGGQTFADIKEEQANGIQRRRLF